MKHKRILGMALAAVLTAGLFTGCAEKKPAAEVVAEQNTYTIGRGDLAVTITGSGRLKAEDEEELRIPAGIEVDAVLAETGDAVKAGDVLAVLDTASLERRAAELSGELAQLDMQIAFRGNNVTTVKAPVRGRIKYIPAQEGEDVIDAINAHGYLCLINTDDLMQVELTLAEPPKPGTEVTVRFEGGKETGKVAAITEKGCLVTLPDKKAPYLGEAEVLLDGAVLGSGVLMLHAPVEVYGNGGIIEKVVYKVNDFVMASAALFNLENTPATDTYRVRLADRGEKAKTLTEILAYLRCPNVVAPCDGVVSEATLQEGKKTAASEANGTEAKAFVLATGGATKLVVEVDELDIAKVYPGQSAEVTLDAYSGERFPATVKRISRIGKLSGSITVYETELALEADDRLIDGMNGSAEILAEKAENAVLVPLGAVREDAEGSYVRVVAADGTPSRQTIVTGLANANFAEVLSGLNEGDRIEYKASNRAMMMNAMMQRSTAMMGGGRN
ncbi:MAG: HlyD family efflux transporter periplasmic adaptor subunit [Clostridia bacterium]|nr:HlyD family efflux transporter periplasmic adaptor subunit [Clostridia bacterium]